ncbi:MAG: hypothetical protein K2X27_03915 [Candidatus Obscuribacterales bacterium]|nr:hypothetical protein [Candidatus Obscuribacterales bacterium]
MSIDGRTINQGPDKAAGDAHANLPGSFDLGQHFLGDVYKKGNTFEQNMAAVDKGIAQTVTGNSHAESAFKSQALADQGKLPQANNVADLSGVKGSDLSAPIAKMMAPDEDIAMQAEKNTFANV